MELSYDPSPRATSPWFQRSPINRGELTVETIAVVVGILLALGINSWHEKRQEQAVVDTALHTLADEINRNRLTAEHHSQYLGQKVTP